MVRIAISQAAFDAIAKTLPRPSGPVAAFSSAAGLRAGPGARRPSGQPPLIASGGVESQHQVK